MDLFTERIEDVTFQDLSEFLGLDRPADIRPSEGINIEYKGSEPKDLSETVAAFANTAGGLIFLGVDADRKGNVPTEVKGIELPGGDVRARFIGRISSQIFPRPHVEIVGVALPDRPEKFVVLLRVAEGDFPPYQSAVGDSLRFPIRVGDTVRSATLRDIEDLFRKRQGLGEPSDVRTQRLLLETSVPQLVLNNGAPAEGPNREKPYHLWVVRPRKSLRIRLDRSIDREFRALISRHFPDTVAGYFVQPTMSSDRHRIQWQISVDNSNQSRIRWARYFEVSDQGDLIFAERIDRKGGAAPESISDIFISSLRFLNLVQNFYSRWGVVSSVSTGHRLMLHAHTRFAATFPDAKGVYSETNAVRFSAGMHALSGEQSAVSDDLDPLVDSAHLVQYVCEFMLSHFRRLRQADIDFGALCDLVGICPLEMNLIDSAF